MGIKKTKAIDEKPGKIGFGADPVALQGSSAVEKANKEFYEKATPKQRAIIDMVNKELGLVDSGLDNQYYLEKVAKEANMTLDEVMIAIQGMPAGEYKEFGKYCLVKTYTNEIQEIKAYARRLESVIARGESEKYMKTQVKKLHSELSEADFLLSRINSMTFWDHIKAAFNSLLSFLK